MALNASNKKATHSEEQLPTGDEHTKLKILGSWPDAIFLVGILQVFVVVRCFGYSWLLAWGDSDVLVDILRLRFSRYSRCVVFTCIQASTAHREYLETLRPAVLMGSEESGELTSCACVLVRVAVYCGGEER